MTSAISVQDYSGLNHARAEEVVKPRTTAEVGAHLDRLGKRAATTVTVNGAGRSFGGQALPPKGSHRVVMQTAAMDSVTVQPQTPDDEARGVLRVVVGAGVSFRALLDALVPLPERYLPV